MSMNKTSLKKRPILITLLLLVVGATVCAGVYQSFVNRNTNKMIYSPVVEGEGKIESLVSLSVSIKFELNLI